MQRKIAFFDIDGTLTSEINGSIPDSTIQSIRKARANGHLMFINTGRCFQNVEERFRSIGFDGYVCGCGTNIYCDGKEVMHIAQSHEVIAKIWKVSQFLPVSHILISLSSVAVRVLPLSTWTPTILTTALLMAYCIQRIRPTFFFILHVRPMRLLLFLTV